MSGPELDLTAGYASDILSYMTTTQNVAVHDMTDAELLAEWDSYTMTDEAWDSLTKPQQERLNRRAEALAFVICGRGLDGIRDDG